MWWLQRATCCVAHSQMRVFNPRLVLLLVYPRLNMCYSSVFIKGVHSTRRTKARLAYSCLKWRIYCEVCLINCFLLTQGGPDGEGKGPVHILLLSPLLPFASICHQRVLQYPRCLILLLTQGSASTGGLATLHRRYEREFGTSLKMVELGSWRSSRKL